MPIDTQPTHIAELLESIVQEHRPSERSSESNQLHKLIRELAQDKETLQDKIGRLETRVEFLTREVERERRHGGQQSTLYESFVSLLQENAVRHRKEAVESAHRTQADSERIEQQANQLKSAEYKVQKMFEDNDELRENIREKDERFQNLEENFVREVEYSSTLKDYLANTVARLLEMSRTIDIVTATRAETGEPLSTSDLGFSL